MMFNVVFSCYAVRQDQASATPIHEHKYSSCAAGSRISSNGAASTSAAAQRQNGKQAVSPSVNGIATDARFQSAVGRESPRVAQVALDPAATPLVDLNAATFEGGDPNRIRLADLILNDGEAASLCHCPLHVLCDPACLCIAPEW